MARPKKLISEEERARVQRIRAEAEGARDEVLGQRPDPEADIVGAIAWTAIVLGDDAPEVELLVEDAKYGQRLEWAEIGIAFGIDPDDRSALSYLSQKHNRRRRARD